MAWLTSKTGRRYYYRRRKVGGRVTSEYVGAGPVAELIAQHDEIERHRAEAQRQAWLRVKAERDALDREIDALGELVRQYVTALMLVSGYHQYKRQWRKKRR